MNAALDLTLGYAPGSGLPYVVLAAGHAVAAFTDPTGRDDFVTAQRKHGVIALTRRAADEQLRGCACRGSGGCQS